MSECYMSGLRHGPHFWMAGGALTYCFGEGDGREGLDRAPQDAARDGSSDRLYGPGDFDRLRSGAGDPGDDGRRGDRVDFGGFIHDNLKTMRVTNIAYRGVTVRLHPDGTWSMVGG